MSERLVIDLPVQEFHVGDRVVVPLPPMQGQWHAPAGWTKHERSISRVWTLQDHARVVVVTVDPQ